MPASPSPHALERFVGRIAAAGHPGGDQLVVGAWHATPVGPFADVMWVRRDGHRTLLAPHQAAADEITVLYRFDTVRIVPVTGRVDATSVTVDAGPVRLRLAAGPRRWASWVFAARPKALRQRPGWIALEDRLVEPLGPLLLGGAPGVRLTGTTPTGRREWYSVDDHRDLVAGTVAVDGDEGRLARLRPDLGVGLSAFPTRPALVTLTTLIAPEGDRRARPTVTSAGPRRPPRR